MGYIHRAHHCALPRDGRSGDIWECDGCRRQYVNFLGLWLNRDKPKPPKPPAEVTT